MDPIFLCSIDLGRPIKEILKNRSLFFFLKKLNKSIEINIKEDQI